MCIDLLRTIAWEHSQMLAFGFCIVVDRLKSSDTLWKKFNKIVFEIAILKSSFVQIKDSACLDGII